ncbi:MAG: hypothetical protein L3J97_01150, partial [Thermoplasmata archaeon]|nr:hypothetical protein [Thermoplasmata archaeon]
MTAGRSPAALRAILRILPVVALVVILAPAGWSGHSAPTRILSSQSLPTDLVTAPTALAAPLPSHPVTAPPPVAPCGNVPAEFALLYRTAPAPPAVRTENATGCVPGADEEGVSYASNQSRSASQFEVTVALPGGATDDARSMSAFFVQVSVSGVPCSLDGRSVLQIDLLPPGSPLGSSRGNIWTVVAPVWDLVPAGSCDPRCENTSVAFSIGGHGFCEDNALAGGVGSPGYGSNPLLSPGDTVRFTIHPGG